LSLKYCDGGLPSLIAKLEVTYATIELGGGRVHILYG